MYRSLQEYGGTEKPVVSVMEGLWKPLTTYFGLES
jgi:hypothetical protein